MAIKVFDGTDNTFSTNGEIVLNPTRAIVHKEDNGSFYLDLETPLTQETKYVAPEEGSSATINGNGQIQNVDSTKESELVSLKGDTYQYTTTGKNLLEPYPMNATKNGITCSYDSATQTYTFNGTCTANNTTFQMSNNSIEIKQNTTRVSAYWVSGSATTYCYLRTYNSDYSASVNLNLTNLSSSTPIVSSLRTGTTYTMMTGGASVRFDNGSVANNLKVKFMIANSTNTDYEPYTGGQASPSPTYPQSIDIVSGLQEVEIVGKNQIGIPNLSQTTTNGLTYSISDNVISVNGTATGMVNVIRLDFSLTNNTSKYLQLYLDSGSWTQGAVGISYRTSADQQLNYVQVSYNASWYSGARAITLDEIKGTGIIKLYFTAQCVFDNAKIRLMLVDGTRTSNVLPYEKYIGKNYEINLGKNLIMYSSYNADTQRSMSIPNLALKSDTYTMSFDLESFELGNTTSFSLYLGLFFEDGSSRDITIITLNNNVSLGRKSLLLTTTKNLLANNQNNIRIGATDYNNGARVKITNIQLEKGNQATSYSEYFTPIELCKIGTYQDKIFKGKGTNIIGLDTQQYKVDLRAGDKISMTNNTSSALQINLYTNYGDTTRNDYWSVGANGRRTITIAYDTKAVAWSSTPNGLAFGNYGDTFLPYEPYNAKDKWLLHKEIGKVVLNGSESGWMSQTQTGFYRYGANMSNATTDSSLSNSILIKSNYFEGISFNNRASNTNETIYLVTNNSQHQFFINTKTYTTLNDFKTWLSTHNTIVYYVLANPTTTEIDNSELVSELNNIELIGGLNNISLSSSYLTGALELKYNFVSGGETTAKYIDYLQANNILVANTPQGNQAFRISNVERTRSKIRLKANHIFYDTQNYVISDSYVVEKNCNQALDHLNDATDNTSPFSMTSDITTLNSYRCVRKSLYEAIQVVLERWGGHLVRDNFDIKVMSSIGNDNGVVVRYGKNLKNISATYNWDAVATKLMPVGKDGLLLPEEYLYASVQYDIPYTKVISFDQNNIVEDDYADADAYQQALIEDLRQKGMEYLASNSIPMVNYTLNANLERITDIGDTIEVIDERLGINLLTNLISYEYNCILDKYTQVQFGNFTPKLQNLMETIASNTEKAIEENNGVIQITLENELIEATDRIWGVLGNSYVIYEGDKILVVDELPKENAHNVIMINSGGIGFSQTGINGTFQSAWTIDNTLNMENINVINLTADLIKGGILKLGSNLNQYGQIEIYNEANNLIAELNKNGFKMYGNDGSYVLMNTQVGFAGYDRNDNKIYWADGDAFHMKKSEVEEEITLCGKMRYIPIHLTDTYGVEHNGIGLVSVLGGGN